MVKAMLRYSRTQLSSYADDLKETLDDLESSLQSNQSQPKVTVVTFDSETVSLSWKFNKEISDFIKSSDRSNFKWTKGDNGNWILKLFWDKSEEYVEAFRKAGYDTSDIATAEVKSKEVVIKD